MGRSLCFHPAVIICDILVCLQVNTVPQGSVDMNKCTEVAEAESLTGHQFSFTVKTPDKTVYMKGSAKDETARYV